MREINEEGLKLLKEFEGYSPIVYKDIAGKDTIGIGHLIKPGEKFTEPLSDEEIIKLLHLDLKEVYSIVPKLIRVKITDNQYAVLVDFAFNLGVWSLSGSTLIQLLNKGYPETVPDQLIRWIKYKNPATGKLEDSAGLLRRRKAECELWTK